MEKFAIKKFNYLKHTFLILLISIIATTLIGQTKYSTNYTKVSVEGSSTLHNWTMISDKSKCNASFNFNGNNIVSLTFLEFTVPVESLKSENKGLDKNAYKALKSSTYPEINFTSSNAKISKSADAFSITLNGKLTISGVTKDVIVMALAKFNSNDKTISTTGSFKIKMSEYKVQRPSVMFGTIKASDEVVVKFNIKLAK